MSAREEVEPRLPAWLTPQDEAAISARYQLERGASSGSMGTVFHAIQRAIGMDVAIKVLRKELAPEQLQREGMMLARVAQVHSPHVVAVHDFEILPSGAAMLVMDWIDGRDLGTELRMRGGRVKEWDALPWMRDTCMGMLAVEEQRLVHRDLKPANIMLDRSGRARVTDFGIARQERLPGDATGTLDRLVAGTPDYMAPERTEHPQGTDIRSDVYSFGATFYHVLTGAPPFQGDSVFSILFKHRTEPLVAPRARNPEVSSAINDVLERCLAKSPNERFDSFRGIIPHLATDSGVSAWGDVEDALLVPYATRFRERCADYLRTDRSRGDVDAFEFPSGRTLRIVIGDIVDEVTDAIVSPGDHDMLMDGAAGQAIARAAGFQVRQEADRFRPVRPGRVVVTSAGALRRPVPGSASPKPRFVFHAVTVGVHDRKVLFPSRDLILECLSSCLYHADTLDLRSIAFPLLGTGAAGYSRAKCLEVMFLFLAKALLRGVNTLRDARIVIYGPSSPG
jgi:O-acetyl-ADP-ribose deacetylase (regulator of RNase III)